MVSAPHGRRTVRPPSRPLRVLDSRRCVPDPRPRQAGRRARDAGCLAHRPRVDGGRGAAVQGGEGNRRQADRRLRGLRRRRPPRAEEGLRPPDAPRGRQRRLLEPDQAVEPRLPRGLLLQAAGRLGAARAARARRDRALRAASRAGCARRSRRTASRTRGAELDRLAQVFGRDNVYVELQNAHLEVQAADPAAARRARRRRPGSRPSRRATSTTSATRTRAPTRRCSASSPATRSRTRTTGSSTPTTSTSRRRGDGRRLPRPGGRRSGARSRSRSAATSRSRSTGSCSRSSPCPTAATRSTTWSSSARRGSTKRYETVTDELRERLRYELKTISEMGFTDYFLIVWDFIHFAKEHGISVGPGRGSAAGSLVSYCLEITDLDPIRYDLLFERFLNPGRKTMPDMDIDFAVAGRERVINYVTEKYGRDRVAQIITFSTMAARAAVRDAGRVLEIPYGAVDRIAKLIPEGPGPDARGVPEAGRRAAQGGRLRPGREGDRRPRPAARGAHPRRLDPRRRRRDRRRAADERRAAPAEGRRPGGRHAVPDEGRRGARAAQDGLPRAAQPRRDRQGGRAGRRTSTSAQIPLDDKETYAMLARGEATGVFQFESSGMREALRQVKPTEFEDIVALVALYRPGPMQYIPTYANRKHGKEPVTYLDPRLKPILGGTLRDLGLPGAVDGDRQGDRRLLALRGRGPPPRDRQEGPRADGVPQGQVHRGVRRERHLRLGRPAALGGHGEGAGLLVQQGARRLLRADLVPDRLADARTTRASTWRR